MWTARNKMRLQQADQVTRSFKFNDFESLHYQKQFSFGCQCKPTQFFAVIFRILTTRQRKNESDCLTYLLFKSNCLGFCEIQEGDRQIIQERPIGSRVVFLCEQEGVHSVHSNNTWFYLWWPTCRSSHLRVLEILRPRFLTKVAKAIFFPATTISGSKQVCTLYLFKIRCGTNKECYWFFQVQDKTVLGRPCHECR